MPSKIQPETFFRIAFSCSFPIAVFQLFSFEMIERVSFGLDTISFRIYGFLLRFTEFLASSIFSAGVVVIREKNHTHRQRISFISNFCVSVFFANESDW